LLESLPDIAESKQLHQQGVEEFLTPTEQQQQQQQQRQQHGKRAVQFDESDDD